MVQEEFQTLLAGLLDARFLALAYFGASHEGLKWSTSTTRPQFLSRVLLFKSVPHDECIHSELELPHAKVAKKTQL